MFIGDAANFLLGGIPGEVHELFVVDVEPEDLAKASATLKDMSVSVHTLHVSLARRIAFFEAGWQGDGKAAFDSELWQPLSHGLGVLDRECEAASEQFAKLAAQATDAHMQKVEALNQEIQNQLWIMGVTTVVASPELGGAISKALVGVATRIGDEAVGRIVASIVEAITSLIQRVVAAFGKVLEWAAQRLPDSISAISEKVDGIFGMIGRPADGEREVPSVRSAANSGATTLARATPIDHRPGVTLEQAAAAAARNGIDMSQIELRYVPKDSPAYVTGKAGFTSYNGAMQPIRNETGQYVINLMDAGLVSEKEAFITIKHELGHIADPDANEAAVEAAALASGEGFAP